MWMMNFYHQIDVILFIIVDEYPNRDPTILPITGGIKIQFFYWMDGSVIDPNLNKPGGGGTHTKGKRVKILK